MPKLAPVGAVQVTWNNLAGRYMSVGSDLLSDVFNRMKPVVDPMLVTVGPDGRAGGPHPWEGNDPATGRRYVARKHRTEDKVTLEEVVDH
jgi:hypothetical protein